MRTVAVIQARMSSSRLPGKSLAEVAGRPLLAWVLERARRAQRVDAVVVATSTDPSDDPIAALCAAEGVACHRGSLTDVLERTLGAAREARAGVVVRLTGDCPLLDSAIIDGVIAARQEADADYASNLGGGFPEGMDVEAVRLDALDRAAAQGRTPPDREHVTWYIRRSDGFTRASLRSALPHRALTLHLSVDEQADLDLVRGVYARLGADPANAGAAAVLAVLDADPALARLNRGVVRDRWFYETIAAEPPIPARTLVQERSLALKERAGRVIPSYTQTFSKNPGQFVQGAMPVYLQRGQGAHVWDVDGNEYVDTILGLGPIILGHNHPAVTGAITRQLAEGTALSLPHPVELEVAEELCAVIPCADMVRFGKNGSDVTAAAVRLARAHTGRDVIACCGYHGWQDWYIGTTTRALGVPQAVRELTVPFTYNDLASLERIFSAHPGQVAGVILEPFVSTLPEPGFLEGVRELAHRHGALLIFDEVITGFRMGLGGAQEFFGVEPDLACFGKALANGMPLSAIAGRAEVMRGLDEVFFSFTFGGEAASLAAAQATLAELRRPETFPHLWDVGQKLMDGFNVLAQRHRVSDAVRCDGLGARSVLVFNDPTLVLKSLFQQEAGARGVLTLGFHNVCAAMTDEDVRDVLRAYNGALAVLAAAIDSGEPARFLKGPPVQPVFRKV
jgi:glutamate-1-semialdehyde aminotransferase/spore coat polysaccharide biosynthesis protein SpsF (cytidylyltransferase family)